MEIDKPASKSKENMIEIRAHKSVLTARADYFKAVFRSHPGSSSSKNNNNKSSSNSSVSSAGKPKSKKNNTSSGFMESDECTITVEPLFNERHIRYILEFIYTNRIAEIRSIATDDLLSILHLSDKWLLRDLKRLVEHALIRDHMRCETVARLYGATEDFSAKRLSRACIEFIMTNLRQLAGNPAFEEEMKNYPHLCMPVLKAAADLIPDGPAHKKQRTSASELHSGGGGTPSSAAAAFRSSPVPDSDA